MAISFKEKIAYVNKYAPKSNDKVQKLIKLAVNIDSAKLNLTDEQKNKLKDGVEKAFQQFKEKNESVKASTPSQAPKKRGRPKGSGKKATSSTSSSKAILQNFKAKVGKKVYKRATTRTNVQIDMERPAVKPGKRIVRKKGETSNQYGTFSNKPGRKYWENRANRMDVNQPSKTRYPKLAKGGEIDMLKEDDNVWNAVGKKLIVDKVTKDEYYLTSFGQPSSSPFGKEKVHKYLSRGEWSLSPKMENGGEMADGGYEPYIYYFYDEDGNEITFRDIKEARSEAKQRGVQKFRDNVGGEYFIDYGDGGSIAKGNYEMVLSKAKELHHHVNELQEVLKKEKDIEAWVVAKVERASQDLSDVTHYLDGTSEYGDGGFVAVGEKDGYWTIITKPTTKEKAQQMIDMGSLPKDEVGKVVTVKEAKDHKKVIGREYLAQGGTLAGTLDVDNIGFGLMAKGGMTMQSIADKYEENEDENAHGENVILLAKHFGTAQDLKEAKAILKKHMEEGHLSSENGAKRRELHMKLIAKARQEMAKEGVKFAKGGKLIGKQKNLDMNNNGKLDKEDFQIIRSGKRIVRKSKK